MDATKYIVLIEVHLRYATFLKGQRLTVSEMGAYAYTLVHYALAVPESQVPLGVL